jgi:hypothetical protein
MGILRESPDVCSYTLLTAHPGGDHVDAVRARQLVGERREQRRGRVDHAERDVLAVACGSQTCTTASSDSSHTSLRPIAAQPETSR